MGESVTGSFEDITERLDEIVSAVRSKDTSLERSLELFDEAIVLGSKAVELVDSFEMSEREAEMLEGGEPQGADDAAGSSGKAAGSGGTDGATGADEGSHEARPPR